MHPIKKKELNRECRKMTWKKVLAARISERRHNQTERRHSKVQKELVRYFVGSYMDANLGQAYDDHIMIRKGPFEEKNVKKENSRSCPYGSQFRSGR